METQNKSVGLRIYIQQTDELDYLKSVIESVPAGKSFGIILIGAKGTGKTLLAENLAESFGCKANESYFSIDGNSELDRTMIEGITELIGGETIFKPAQLCKAFTAANENKIAFLIINEVNAIRPNQQISLNSALSEGSINLISTGTNMTLNKDAKLIVIGTMNKNVLGINKLQEAFDDRFAINKNVEYPPAHKEVEILCAVSGCSEEFAKIIVEAANHLRNAAIKDCSISKLFSTRMAVNFATIVTRMNGKFLDHSIECMITSKLAEEQEEESSIIQLLKGMDFKERIEEVFALKEKSVVEIPAEAVFEPEKVGGVVPVEEFVPVVPVSPVSPIAAEFVAKIPAHVTLCKAVTEANKRMTIFYRGLITKKFLVEMFQHSRNIFRAYIKETLCDATLTGEYTSKTKRKVFFSGLPTNQYIVWLYKNYRGRLSGVITKLI